MKITETGISDLYIIESEIFGDQRGYFMESYKKFVFDKEIAAVEFIQDNESFSGRGVLRGLHFQLPPYTQSKLVRVISGEVLDVVVDLRKNSLTFGKSFSILLSGENKKQLFVPKGFAHGFVVLSESAIFSYKVDALYRPEFERGIRWNDPALEIDWKIDEQQVKLSEKDRELPYFSSFNSPF